MGTCEYIDSGRIKDEKQFFSLVGVAEHRLKGQSQLDFITQICEDWIESVKQKKED